MLCILLYKKRKKAIVKLDASCRELPAWRCSVREPWLGRTGQALGHEVEHAGSGFVQSKLHFRMSQESVGPSVREAGQYTTARQHSSRGVKSHQYFTFPKEHTPVQVNTQKKIWKHTINCVSLGKVKENFSIT